MAEHRKIQIATIGEGSKELAKSLSGVMPPCCYKTSYVSSSEFLSSPGAEYDICVYYPGDDESSAVGKISGEISKARVAFIVGASPLPGGDSGIISIKDITPHDMAGVIKKTSESLWAAERLSVIEQNARSLAGAAGAFSALGKCFQSSSHDIKNTLAVISGHAQTMLGSPCILDGGDDDFVHSINTIEKHAHRILDRLNLISMIGAQRSAPRFQVCRIDDIKDDLTAIFSTPLKKNEMTMDIEVEPTATRSIFTDRSFLTRAIFEVVFNGIENADKGGKITMNISASDDPGFLRVKVSDNGKPIGDEEFSRMFESFYTTKEFRAGLGLPTARELVSLIGGSARAEKNENGNATVIIETPIQER